MNAASIDILDFLTWSLICLGGAFISVLVWIANQVGNRLSGIESELKVTNSMLGQTEEKLREDLINHDKRLMLLEFKAGTTKP